MAFVFAQLSCLVIIWTTFSPLRCIPCIILIGSCYFPFSAIASMDGKSPWWWSYSHISGTANGEKTEICRKVCNWERTRTWDREWKLVSTQDPILCFGVLVIFFACASEFLSYFLRVLRSSCHTFCDGQGVFWVFLTLMGIAVDWLVLS